MNQEVGHLVSRSKPTNTQGSIHTENPELLKLLQENSSENKIIEKSLSKNISAETNKKETDEQIHDSNRKSPNTDNLKNIKYLVEGQNKNVTISDDFIEKNSPVSGAGDAKVSSFCTEEKENYGLHNKSAELQKIGGNFNDFDECKNNSFPEISSGKYVDFVKRDARSVNEIDNNINVQKLVKQQNTSSNLNREVTSNKLSDIAESDCDTLRSSSCELAELRSPSRNSLNADFQDSSFPSSPAQSVYPVSGRYRDREDAAVESDRYSTDSSGSNTRAAGSTPYYRYPRQENTNSPAAFKRELQHSPGRKLNQNTSSASKFIDSVPYGVTALTHSKELFQKFNSLKTTGTKTNFVDKSVDKTIAIQEAGNTFANKNKSKANTPANLHSPGIGITHTGPSVTYFPVSTSTSRRVHESRNIELNPAYSELSPRLYSRSCDSVNNISSKLLQKHLRDRSSVHLENTLNTRYKASYQSQRLKLQGDAAKRSGSVLTSKDSLDSLKEKWEKEFGEKSDLITDSPDIEKDSPDIEKDSPDIEKDDLDIEKDSLDIEKDSLEISPRENKKDNTVSKVDWTCHNQVKITENSIQESESVLQNNLTKQYHNSNKLDNDKCDDAEQSDKANIQGSRVNFTGEKHSFSRVDLLTRVNVNDKDEQKQTITGNTDFPLISSEDKTSKKLCGNSHEQLTAHLMQLETTKVITHENIEFIIRTDTHIESTSMFHSAERNSHSTDDQKADPLEVTGSATRNSNRVKSGVRKVYVESPTFTREEEDIYKFVDTQIDDTKEGIADTYRELDMAAVQNQDKYSQKRVRYTDIDGRYEDRENHILGSENNQQFSSGNTTKYPQLGGLQESQSGQNAAFEGNNQSQKNGFNSYEQNTRIGGGFQQPYSNPTSQINSHQGLLSQHGLVKPSQNQLNQHGMANPPHNLFIQHGIANPSQVLPNQGLINPSQVFPNEGLMNPSYGLLSQQGLVNQFQFPSNQPETERNITQSQQGRQGLQSTTGYQHQPHLNQQQPHFGQQQAHINEHQSKSNQQQPEQTGKPPVRGLTLPSGPTYDPVDEEDLKRETNYQQGLRGRVEDGNRKAQQVTIPQIPVNFNPNQHHQFVGPDFPQDSLDYGVSDEAVQSFGGEFVQDLITMYPSQQQPQAANHFKNPPHLPQHFTGYDNRGSFQNSSRLDNVNFDSDDYTDHVDIRQQRVNPQIRPRFYNPQTDQHYGRLNNEEYIDGEPNTNRTEADAVYDDPQRYEDPQEECEDPMEAVRPNHPKYDFVTHNKEDLGLQHPKSYTRIHENNRDEKDRLQDFFINPKPKSKVPAVRRKSQGQQRSQFTEYQPQNNSEMTPAEQVWAQRSATLAKKFDSTSSNRGRGRGTGGLQKFHSDSSLSQAMSPHRRPNFQTPPHHHQQQQQREQQQAQDTKTFITEMPTPLKEGHSQKHPNPGPIRQTEMMVQPITQQILTQDGQRISVDVNLKLISPASIVDGSQQYYYPQQYPPTHQPPQYPLTQYPNDEQTRQYPVNVASYNEFDRQRVPALEYYSQEYDSDNNEYRHGSPRERYSADEALRLLNDSRTQLNPYGKIPPISGTQEHPSSAPMPDQSGSYMDMYMKQRIKDNDRPWYKVYGLSDYRRMQKEVRLGTLGPDLDSDAVRERREKMTRQNEYAKVIMDKNKNVLANRKPPAFPRPKEDNDIINRRKLAIEYAKSVPKPATKTQPNEFNNYELASEKSPIAKHHRQGPQPGGQKNSPHQQVWRKEKEIDILDIEKLRQRYEEDKQNEAVIRRNTHSSNRENYY